MQRPTVSLFSFGGQEGLWLLENAVTVTLSLKVVTVNIVIMAFTRGSEDPPQGQACLSSQHAHQLDLQAHLTEGDRGELAKAT